MQPFGKQKMEIDAPLKPPEYKRNEQGQLARPEGFTLRKAPKKTRIKKQNSRTVENNLPKDGEAVKAGPGRPKGAQGKIPLALKEAILASLDELGGKEYLKKLAIENSSAYAGLIGKVLPSTLAMSDSDGGNDTTIQFVRVIVTPDGHRHVQGKTPLQIEHQSSQALPETIQIDDRASHMLPSELPSETDDNDIR